MQTTTLPFDLLRPQRTITGMSAVSLPFDADGGVAWDAFDAHVARTAGAGLVPAVNMDTGYVHLLDDETRRHVLDRSSAVLGGGEFVAGAFVHDRPGDSWNPSGHRREMAAIAERGGLPVVFPCHALGAQAGAEVVAAHAALARDSDRFLAFELGPQFAPFGVIHDLDTWTGLLEIDACIGAKHSSLHRAPEWARLRRRDEVRPEFSVLTGNDLAIDMVMYGSDYLLGLSTLAPDHFARRDAAWAAGDPSFFELDDALQALGDFVFRPPVPAYRHSVAQFLVLRGWIEADTTPPGVPRRPSADVEVLRTLRDRLDAVS